MSRVPAASSFCCSLERGANPSNPSRLSLDGRRSSSEEWEESSEEEWWEERIRVLDGGRSSSEEELDELSLGLPEILSSNGEELSSLDELVLWLALPHTAMWL